MELCNIHEVRLLSQGGGARGYRGWLSDKEILFFSYQVNTIFTRLVGNAVASPALSSRTAEAMTALR